MKKIKGNSAKKRKQVLCNHIFRPPDNFKKNVDTISNENAYSEAV